MVFSGFWVLLSIGWLRGEFRPRSVAIFIGLWLVGFFGLRSILFGLLFVSFVSVLDVALVFAVVHGDVKIF